MILVLGFYFLCFHMDVIHMCVVKLLKILIKCFNLIFYIIYKHIIRKDKGQQKLY
jgi:hypothetical protein